MSESHIQAGKTILIVFGLDAGDVHVIVYLFLCTRNGEPHV